MAIIQAHGVVIIFFKCICNQTFTQFVVSNGYIQSMNDDFEKYRQHKQRYNYLKARAVDEVAIRMENSAETNGLGSMMRQGFGMARVKARVDMAADHVAMYGTNIDPEALRYASTEMLRGAYESAVERERILAADASDIRTILKDESIPRTQLDAASTELASVLQKSKAAGR